MFTHFSGNGGRSEPKHQLHACSECGCELYADEKLICQECEDKLKDEQFDYEVQNWK